MSDCLFCKMVAGDIQPDVIFENELILAFRDLQPQAPCHFLVIPKKHIASINDLVEADVDLIGQLYFAAKTVAKQEGIATDGFRTVMNCNADGGQTVFHIHLHVLGGRALNWPPG